MDDETESIDTGGDVAPTPVTEESTETSEEIVEEISQDVSTIENEISSEDRTDLLKKFEDIYARLSELDRRTIGVTDQSNNADIVTTEPTITTEQTEVHQEKGPEPTKWWFRKWKRNG